MNEKAQVQTGLSKLKICCFTSKTKKQILTIRSKIFNVRSKAESRIKWNLLTLVSDLLLNYIEVCHCQGLYFRIYQDIDELSISPPNRKNYILSYQKERSVKRNKQKMIKIQKKGFCLAVLLKAQTKLYLIDNWIHGQSSHRSALWDNNLCVGRLISQYRTPVTRSGN